MAEGFEKIVRDILENERWQGYASGKVEGALSVLHVLDLNKEKKIELLSEAIGLSWATARDFLESEETEEREYKNEDLSNDKAVPDVSMTKKEIRKQREIGKQLLIVDIIHHENKMAKKVGFSFVHRGNLAAWAALTKDELDHFMDVYTALDPYNMATEAAKECCKEEPFKSEKEAYCFVLYTYFRMERLCTVWLKRGHSEDSCRYLSEYNYQVYSEIFKEYPVPEFYSTAEVFEKMMRCYIRFLIASIKKAISEGYDCDVITSMARGEVFKDKYISIVNALATECKVE